MTATDRARVEHALEEAVSVSAELQRVLAQLGALTDLLNAGGVGDDG